MRVADDTFSSNSECERVNDVTCISLGQHSRNNGVVGALVRSNRIPMATLKTEVISTILGRSIIKLVL